MSIDADTLVLLSEALTRFLPDAKHAPAGYSFEPTSGGVNNVVFYVHSAQSNERLFVLRVYNNGNDTNKVHFEHAVLSCLRRQELTFRIPEAIESLDVQDSFVKLSSGACACIFRLIPGKLPKLSSVREIGTASGELSTALSKINIDEIGLPSPNPPYYELYRVHHAANRELFVETMNSPAFDNWRSSADFVLQQIETVEQRIADYHALNLPKQLIHGDLHYDNVLCVEDGSVSGLLDFEFCALDWRAMELAICLSKYAGEPDPLVYFEPFLDGFCEFGRLNATEISVVPALIILRILSNVVYFVGRAVAKEDSIDTLTCRIETYCNRVRWISSNSQVISNLIAKKYAKYAST